MQEPVGASHKDSRTIRGHQTVAESLDALESAEDTFRRVLGTPMTVPEIRELRTAWERSQFIRLLHGPDYHGFGNPPGADAIWASLPPTPARPPLRFSMTTGLPPARRRRRPNPVTDIRDDIPSAVDADTVIDLRDSNTAHERLIRRFLPG